jgi:hypothetical protein
MSAASDKAFVSSDVPALHKIMTHSFATEYSCNGGSYQASALFLTKASIAQNAPELLLNGVCVLGSAYFEGSMAGNDMALLSDLGVFPLANVSAEAAFNKQWVTGGDNTFKMDVDVVQGHTYSVLLARDDLRALFAVEVTKHDSSTGATTIDYAVLLYERHVVTDQSPGFAWNATNN